MKKSCAILLIILIIFSSFSFILSENVEKSKKDKGELEVKVIKESTGACVDKAAKGDIVSVHYTGKLENGQVFDTSLKSGKPLNFELGSGRVIKGFERGVIGMCPGETREIKIPPHLGYGDKGVQGVIPPKSTLIFEIQLEKIERTSIFDSLPGFVATASPLIGILLLGYFLYQRLQEEGKNKPTKKEKKKK